MSKNKARKMEKSEMKNSKGGAIPQKERATTTTTIDTFGPTTIAKGDVITIKPSR